MNSSSNSIEQEDAYEQELLTKQLQLQFAKNRIPLPPFMTCKDNQNDVNGKSQFKIVPDDGKPDLKDNSYLAPEHVVLRL